jgi:hypothetical protein
MSNWKRYAIQLNRIEAKYLPLILKALKKQYSSFTSDLQNHGIDYARSHLNTTAVNDDLLPVINDLYQKVGLWGAQYTFGELRDAQKRGAKGGGFGRNAMWVRNVLDFLKLHALEFVQAISNTTKNDILKFLQFGIDNGYSISEIVQLMTTKGIAEARARLITRTEVVRAVNVGHQEGAKSFPYEVNKKWQAANDHRTRHSHRYIDNHVVDENGTFKVPVYKGDKPTGDFDEMLAPGDPKASAANTVNCRCRVIYEAKLDANGQMIPKRNPATVIPLRRQTTEISPDLEQIRAIL